ncbi:MAG: hypothetical protein H8E44_04175 [Planctomycetes bacterium]|nr:hypothetical protein [Planctomycetota bacterium]
MYALYAKSVVAERVTYQHRADVSLFGCNAGYIPRFVRTAMPQRQSEPYKWHVPVQDALANAGQTKRSPYH